MKSVHASLSRLYNYMVRKRERGVRFKFNFIKHLSKSFFIDVNGGLTSRFVNYIEPALPPDINTVDVVEDNFFDFPNETNRTDMAPLFGFRVGYHFR